MPRPEIWMVVDVSSVAAAAFFAMPKVVRVEVEPIVWMILRSLRSLEDIHHPDCSIFCFDGGYDRRRELCPSYKKRREDSRRQAPSAERKSHRSYRRALYQVRTTHLPALGFRNILQQEGYEADDLIAAVCDAHASFGRQLVLVSSDEDLFQLLSDDRVLIWNHKTKSAITAESFRREKGISPGQWADVKALAGCSTDEVRGVEQVGEKKAIAFLTGKLNQGVVHHRIIQNHHIWERNLPIVQLPFEGTEVPEEMELDGRLDRPWEKYLSGLGEEPRVKTRRRRKLPW